ncbi:MAG: hypothetical protein KBB91_00510 [Candidatus Pacebacteria bacterium]|nr:hypothetical protein [Candidatus Paceibacterota bacterium]
MIAFSVGFFVVKNPARNDKKSMELLNQIDSKIADFKSKEFTSLEEKESAKSYLKSELLKMKDSIKVFGRPNATLALREKALSKIIEL